MSRGILLVNLGTPASTATRDVRRYLNDFLMDRYVLDVPWPLRRLIVSGFILPFRPKRSAEAYAAIWDQAGPGTGSPLLHYSRRLAAATRDSLNMPCELAMRYGEPRLEDALARLEQQGVRELLLVPLYPQFADSTCTTTVRRVQALVQGRMKLQVLTPFYARPDYIAALAASVRRHLPPRWDHLLLSYHGLPERHITRADPTGKHCLQSPDCCERPSPAHATCYRHQCFRTSQRLAEALDVPADRYTVSFQSRLGRLPWLTPYTDQTLAALPGHGVRDLVVACPAFVADNLETLEEIGMQGRDTFLGAGGASFTLVPCLNDQPDWVAALASWCREAMQSTDAAAAAARTPA
ncbi:MAG: ferrochelatase [Pseudomonadales bacterium]